MTDIQVKYWTYKEGQRHNLAQEGETYRHDVASEKQAARELIETNRHSVMMEKLQHRGQTMDYNIKKQQLTETARHNKAQEGISQMQAMAAASQARTAAKNAALRGQELDFAKTRWSDEVLNVRAQAAKNRADMDLSTQRARTEAFNTDVREVDSQFAAWEKTLGGLGNASRIVGTVLKKVLD